MNYQINHLKAILIDNEPLSRLHLRQLLKSYPNIIVVAETGNVSNSISAISLHQPDLVFLDTQLGNSTGFSVLDHFPNPSFQIIFCDYLEQFAFRAIKNNALDYLLKPILQRDLDIAIKKATEINALKKPPQLVCYVSGEICLVESKEVCHIDSDGAYTTIHLSGGRRYVQTRSLRAFEHILPSQFFVRTHQSHIINLQFVEKINLESLTLKMKDGSEIPVARRRRSKVFEAFGLGRYVT